MVDVIVSGSRSFDMGRPRKAKHLAPAAIEPEEESQEVPEEEPEVEEEEGEPGVAGEKGMNKSQAARAAVDAGYEKPVEAVAYIKRKFGIDMNPQHFSSIKSNYRKAQGEAKPAKKAEPPAPRKRSDAVEGYVAPPPKQADGGDLLDTLEALKPLIAQHGAERVKQMVDLLG
jgi:hypothetical protein